MNIQKKKRKSEFYFFFFLMSSLTEYYQLIQFFSKASFYTRAQDNL